MLNYIYERKKPKHFFTLSVLDLFIRFTNLEGLEDIKCGVSFASLGHMNAIYFEKSMLRSFSLIC